LGVLVWGFGFWGLGFGPKTPIPNPQSPIPNPQSPIITLENNLILKLFYKQYKILFIYFILNYFLIHNKINIIIRIRLIIDIITIEEI